MAGTGKWSDDDDFAPVALLATDKIPVLRGTSNKKGLASTLPIAIAQIANFNSTVDTRIDAKKNVANGVWGIDADKQVGLIDSEYLFTDGVKLSWLGGEFANPFPGSYSISLHAYGTGALTAFDLDSNIAVVCAEWAHNYVSLVVPFKQFTPSAPTSVGSSQTQFYLNETTNRLAAIAKTTVDVPLAFSGFLDVTDKAVANGLATLDGSVKIPVAQIPDSVIYTDAKVRAVTLTGLSIQSAAITASDTILSAAGKTQGQINSIGGRNAPSGYLGIDINGDITLNTGMFFYLNPDQNSFMFSSSLSGITLLNASTSVDFAINGIVVQSVNENGVNTKGLTVAEAGIAITGVVPGETNVDGATGRKLVNYASYADTHRWYGIGYEINQQTYHVGSAVANHDFYAGLTSSTSSLVFSILGTGGATTTGPFSCAALNTFGLITAQSGQVLRSGGALVFNNSGNTFSTSISAGTLTDNSNYKLPSANATANTYLKNNGAGILSWETIAPGTLTNLDDAKLQTHTGSTRNYLQYVSADSSVSTSFDTYDPKGPMLVGKEGFGFGSVSALGVEKMLFMCLNGTEIRSQTDKFSVNGKLYLGNGGEQNGLELIGGSGTWGGSEALPDGGSVLFGYSGVVLGGLTSGTALPYWALVARRDGSVSVRNELNSQSITSVGTVLTSSQRAAIASLGTTKCFVINSPSASVSAKRFFISQVDGEDGVSKGYLSIGNFRDDMTQRRETIQIIPSSDASFATASNIEVFASTMTINNPTKFQLTNNEAYLDSATVWKSNACDRRLKDNIESIDGQTAVNFIASLDMSSFTYKSDDSGKKHINLVAQDFTQAIEDAGLSDLLHDAVFENANGFYGLSLDCVYKLLVPAIKNINTRLNALETVH